MSLLHTVAPEHAQGTVAETYEAVNQAVGMVPNAIRMYSTNPRILKSRWQEIGYFMQHPTLSAALFACIRLLVSVGERCDYCVTLNTGMLINRFGWSPEQVRAAKENPEQAPLNDKEKALLLLVLRAVRDSNGVPAQAVASLRDAGCTDLEIFDALYHGAQQVAGDIMLNTLKVEIDF